MRMTSSREWMPPDVACEVMEQLKWERGASAVFRRVCKGWRDVHDQCLRHLSVNARLRINSARRFNSALMKSRFILRFQRVHKIDVRGDPLHRAAVAGVCRAADKWLRALAGLTDLTSLDLCGCSQTTGCWRWLASLPSPTSTCTAVAKCQRTGCEHWPVSPPSPLST
jgi:hypothetical protein